MSKKLIAIASAAALALTGLVATSAGATVGPFDVVTTQSATKSIANTNGSTGDLEHTILVPSQDVLRYDSLTTAGSSTTGTLLRYEVVTPTAGAAISVTAAGGGAKLISATQLAAGSLTTASGTTTLSLTSDTAGDAAFYAYTTSTADSTITVSSAGASEIVYMKGVSAKANSYKLNFAVSPLASAASGELTFTGTVTDMFGNLMTLAAGDVIVDGLGGNLGADATQTEWAQNSTTKVVTFVVANRSTTGAAALSLKAHTTIGVSGVITKVTAFGDPVTTQFFSVNAVDLSAQVTSLTAQVAALTAQLAESRPVATSVTKKKYNTLARKWNAANPGARVALKK
jgi:hypothetical protein